MSWALSPHARSGAPRGRERSASPCGAWACGGSGEKPRGLASVGCGSPRQGTPAATRPRDPSVTVGHSRLTVLGAPSRRRAAPEPAPACPRKGARVRTPPMVAGSQVCEEGRVHGPPSPNQSSRRQQSCGPQRLELGAGWGGSQGRWQVAGGVPGCSLAGGTKAPLSTSFGARGR